ncbi:integrase core domain-containing protein [Hyphomonas polymorpha]|uniref:integrase core domain-containing protein n=1 Tax=Hyphomonas polymorpha TaxID=74319 RepID=UPI000A04D79F|nr:integrase core domain-containing protein [Hyphomonas polymorpha]
MCRRSHPRRRCRDSEAEVFGAGGPLWQVSGLTGVRQPKTLGRWRRDYNTVRPHSAIGNKPPASLINHAGVTSPPV